jgi:hypothetical protein
LGDGGMPDLLHPGSGQDGAGDRAFDRTLTKNPMLRWRRALKNPFGAPGRSARTMTSRPTSAGSSPSW